MYFENQMINITNYLAPVQNANRPEITNNYTDKYASFTVKPEICQPFLITC